MKLFRQAGLLLFVLVFQFSCADEPDADDGKSIASGHEFVRSQSFRNRADEASDGHAKAAPGVEFQVNVFTLNSQAFSSAAMSPDGRFVVVWQSYNQDGAGEGIFARRHDAAGNPQGGVFQANVYTMNSQAFPSAAMASDGRFVAAWQSYGQDGSLDGIFARRFDALGLPQGFEFRVNTYTIGTQENPSTATAPDGRFVVAWDSWDQDGSGEGIFAQRYDALGLQQGGEFRVNANTTDHQAFPSAAMAADGRFVVAWQSNAQDGSDYGIYARRYDDSGLPQGGEFRVNATTAGRQAFPSAATASDGRFLVAWESESDGSDYGIFAQRYDASGAPQGGEFRINTCTTDEQRFPSAAMAPDGRFVVAWTSLWQDGDQEGIYAQRYDASGEPQGGEFRVNTYAVSTQIHPSAAMSSEGLFVMTWSSSGQDGSNYGIFAKLFECVVDADCPAGEICTDGLCSPIPTTTTTTTTAVTTTSTTSSTTSTTAPATTTSTTTTSPASTTSTTQVSTTTLQPTTTTTVTVPSSTSTTSTTLTDDDADDTEEDDEAPGDMKIGKPGHRLSRGASCGC